MNIPFNNRFSRTWIGLDLVSVRHRTIRIHYRVCAISGARPFSISAHSKCFDLCTYAEFSIVALDRSYFIIIYIICMLAVVVWFNVFVDCLVNTSGFRGKHRISTDDIIVRIFGIVFRITRCDRPWFTSEKIVGGFFLFLLLFRFSLHVRV